MTVRASFLISMSAPAISCSSSAGRAVTDAASQVDGGPSVACDFTQTATLSAKIGTVGVVAWSTALASPTSAHVDFGLTTSYGMVAPADVSGAAPYQTLLLGMKASSTYHYRLVAQDAAGTCTGPDQTITTGALPNGVLPQIQVQTSNAAALFGGFLISGMSTGGAVPGAGSGGSPAFILDADGDVVWWYVIASDVTGARMSYDGTHIWLNSVNVGGGASSTSVHRVSMDGLTDEDLSDQFAGQNHMMAVLPDETVAFNAYGSNNCDDIKLRQPDGTVMTVINARTAHGGSGSCHVNNVEYSRDDDTLVFSDLDNQDITKVTRSGQVVWVLNGVGNQCAGAIVGGQSGGGTGDGSIAIEMTLDPFCSS